MRVELVAKTARFAESVTAIPQAGDRAEFAAQANPTEERRPSGGETHITPAGDKAWVLRREKPDTRKKNRTGRLAALKRNTPRGPCPPAIATFQPT
jgi:hypothetical protein